MPNIKEIMNIQKNNSINSAMSSFNSMSNLRETVTNGWRGLGLRQMNTFGKQTLSDDYYTIGSSGGGSVSD